VLGHLGASGHCVAPFDRLEDPLVLADVLAQ
jgi:hypothetical protein